MGLLARGPGAPAFLAAALLASVGSGFRAVMPRAIGGPLEPHAATVSPMMLERSGESNVCELSAAWVEPLRAGGAVSASAAGSLLDLSASAAGKNDTDEEAKRLFYVQKPEGVMQRDALVCWQGRLVGVKLPQKPPTKQERFHYVRFCSLMWEAVDWYADTADGKIQFLIFPPVGNLTSDWRLIYRRYIDNLKARDGAWGDDRIFSLEGGRPCSD